MPVARGVVRRALRRRFATFLMSPVASMSAVPKYMHAKDGDSNQNPNPIR